MKPKPKNLMTLGEFRQFIGVPARTLRYWISTGRIPVRKIPNGRGGFSKRIKLSTAADWIALEKSFAMRPARGPCPRLPLPVPFRKTVRELTQNMGKTGERYRKKGKPLVAKWRAVFTACKWKYPEEEVERAILNQAGKVPV